MKMRLGLENWQGIVVAQCTHTHGIRVLHVYVETLVAKSNPAPLRRILVGVWRDQTTASENRARALNRV